ncbi:MAG: carboxypeptidase regulatory-like domain-containing protein [Blastocatellia bacterium]
MAKRRSLLLSFFFTLMLSLPAFAQDARGSLTGTVSDAAGAAIAGARVEVRNPDTNLAINSTTNDEGVYFVPFLLPGRYAVAVEARGYKKAVRGGIEVRVEDKLKLDFALEVGDVSETVTVTASGPALETATGSLGQVVDGKALAELPLADGNPFTLARLAPGMFEDHTADPKATSGASYINTVRIGANGLSSNQAGRSNGISEFTLDGSPNTGYGGRLGYSPPSDAVEEFKILTNSFDAANGRTGAATINVATKSGKNRLFGTASDFVRNDARAQRDAQPRTIPAALPAIRLDRFAHLRRRAALPFGAVPRRTALQRGLLDQRVLHLVAGD